MPRPLRIEYPGALYHVMNRGRGRQPIFHGSAYYRAFLESLAESYERFNAQIHAYCLMGNHYHLLLETPDANLSRIMRHINGLYTQRYNRLKQTDGPLFRGRFKAIVVDADAYLLQVGRYIHRNPLETKRPLVKRLIDYPWSSYPAYAGAVSAPKWLNRELTYQCLGKRQRYRGYQTYVERGVDEETSAFYAKAHTASVLGDKPFRDKVLDDADHGVTNSDLRVHGRPALERVVQVVAQAYQLPQSRLTERQPGRQQANMPRKVAMYLAQQVSYPLQEIADYFGVGHVGSVSNAISAVKGEIKADPGLDMQIRQIKQNVWL